MLQHPNCRVMPLLPEKPRCPKFHSSDDRVNLPKLLTHFRDVDSRSEHWLYRLRILWLLSVPSGEFRDIIWKWPAMLLTKNFASHYSLPSNHSEALTEFTYGGKKQRKSQQLLKIRNYKLLLDQETQYRT